MQTDTSSPSFDGISMKVAAAAVIAVCLLLGLAGLILPLVPGLLFLALAAFVAARMSPRFARILRENGCLRGYLDQAERVAELPFKQKSQVLGLLLLKVLIDGVELLVAGVMKFIRAVDRATAR
jgi:uncharacterized membrane protein YbaN (DUF454 family)